MFDLSTTPASQHACDAGYEFEAQYPDGTPSGVRLRVCGPESTAARAYSARRYREIQAREMAARRAGREADPPGADELEEQMIDLASTYTLGWSGILDGGVPLECNTESKRRLYRLHPWLRAQAVAEAQRLGNFIRPSRASCSSTPVPSSLST